MWIPGNVRARMIRAAADRDREPKVGTPEARIECQGAVEWIEAAEGTEGQPKKFSLVGYTGGALQVGLYYRPVVIDLAGLEAQASEIPALLGHDSERIVGHGTPDISATRVKMAGVVSGGGDAAKEVLESSAKGFPWKASVGVYPTKREFVEEGATAKANGRVWKGPINIVRGGILGEISFVPIAADPKTSVSVAASREEQTMDKQFRLWLEAKGFEPDALSDVMQATLQAAYDAEKEEPSTPAPVEGQADTSEPPGGEDPVLATRQAIAAEVKRANEIRAICKGEHGEIEAKAIEQQWSIEKVELEVLRASRSAAPAAHIHSGPEFGAGVIEAAMCQALAVADHEKQFDDKTLQAAHTQFRGNIGLQEVILIAARKNGHHVTTFRNDAASIKPILRAAFSTADVSGILSNVANKSLMESFNKVEQTWRRVAEIGTVNDFKTHTRYRLTGDLAYEELGAGGKIRHGTAEEESYQIAADTYARMFALTRTDLINDNLGALRAMPKRLGRGAGIKINRVFWTEFLADASTFFTTTRGNYFTGATSVLSSTSLATAVTKFRKMEDSDGDPVGAEPAILLVPPELETTADALYKSLNLITGEDATKPAANVHAGKYEPAVSSYLSNDNYTGYSTTAWYLLADPDDIPMIEIAFLNGKEMPTVESADADFDTLGVQFRGYHDFGVAKKDYRAATKSKGAA